MEIYRQRRPPETWSNSSQTRSIYLLLGENQNTDILIPWALSKKSNEIACDCKNTSYDLFLRFVESLNFSNRHIIFRPHYTLPSSHYSAPFYANEIKLHTDPGLGFKEQQQRDFCTMSVLLSVHKRPETHKY